MNKLLRGIKAINEINTFLHMHAYGELAWDDYPEMRKMLDRASILKDKIIADEEWSDEE
jgi:hypothetical protein